MSWLSTTDNEDFSQVTTEKGDFLIILDLEGQVYYGEPNEMRSLSVSELQGNMSQCMRFPIMWYVRPAKAQISLRIRTV